MLLHISNISGMDGDTFIYQNEALKSEIWNSKLAIDELRALQWYYTKKIQTKI